jgi:hypothetical protein
MSTNSNFVKLPDVVEADAVLQTITADANGNLQTTYQKVLVDDTDGSQENDGDPVTFQLSDEGTENLMAIIAGEIADNENATSGDTDTTSSTAS